MNQMSEEIKEILSYDKQDENLIEESDHSETVTEVTETQNTTEDVEETTTPTDAETKDTSSAKETDAPLADEPVESMDDYKEELEASLKSIHEGDILTGTVIGTTDTEVILDLKYYAQGIIRQADLSSNPGFSIKENISVGQSIKATVIRKDDGQGNILLSSKEANDLLAWEKLTGFMDDKTILTLKIQGVVKAGVIVYVEGIRGFIPASQLSLSYVEDLETYLFKEVQARIITANQDNNKLVLSVKDVLKDIEKEERKAKISNVEVGLVTEGTVDSIQPYGAFVDLGNGISGLVHISQISEKRIKNPAAVVTVGEKVKVKVIAVKDGKISLSMKALLDAAVEDVQQEKIELPASNELSTNLGSLLSKLKF